MFSAVIVDERDVVLTFINVQRLDDAAIALEAAKASDEEIERAWLEAECAYKVHRAIRKAAGMTLGQVLKAKERLTNGND